MTVIQERTLNLLGTWNLVPLAPQQSRISPKPLIYGNSKVLENN